MKFSVGGLGGISDLENNMIQDSVKRFVEEGLNSLYKDSVKLIGISFRDDPSPVSLVKFEINGKSMGVGIPLNIPTCYGVQRKLFDPAYVVVQAFSEDFRNWVEGKITKSSARQVNC